MDLLYLDLCCYKRPFDRQTSARVREETAAVARILEAVGRGGVGLVRSPALLFENEKNRREDRRLAAAYWMNGATVEVPFSAEVERRGRELLASGFQPMDAFHVAYAEASGSKYLVTCDQGLLHLAVRHAAELRVRVIPPHEFLREYPL